MKQSLYLFIFIFLIIGASCTSAPKISPNPNVTITPAIQTPQLSSVAPVTFQATLTPVATLPVEIQKQNLIELFLTNGNCNFPCWWGISSGDSIERAFDLAPILGESLYDYKGSVYSYSLSLGNVNTPDLNVGYYIDNNSQNIDRMEVILNEPSRFRDYHTAFEVHLSLANLLSRYGKPSEVLFLVQPRFEPGETPRSYTLFLIYDELDFGIVYSGLVDSENPLQVCSIKPDNYYLQSISLYLRDPRLKIKEISRFNSAELTSIEQVTSMNLDDFYQTFSEYDNNNCIEVSIDPWQ